MMRMFLMEACKALIHELLPCVQATVGSPSTFHDTTKSIALQGLTVVG